MSCTRNLFVAALGVLLVAGCSAPASPAPSPTPTQPFALAIDPAAVLEELGPLPPFEEPSPERLAAYRQTVADLAWASVSSSYPDAVRFTGQPTYLPNTEANAAARACLAEQGLELPEGGTDDQALVKASTLARYTCTQQFVDEGGPGLSETQAAYLYDYQTAFVLPCYEDTGHPVVTPPIDRDDYIAKWPFQYWSPVPSRIEMMTLEYDQLELMCPAVPEEWG